MEDTSQVIVRHMNDNDLAAIVDIDNKIVGSERLWRQRASSHFRIYHGPLSHVAEIEGKVIGFIMGDIRGAEYALPLSGYIDIIGVDPEHQGKGIGRKLLDAFVYECRDRGIKARGLLRDDEKRHQNFLMEAGFEKGGMVEYVKGFD